jgi:hypothetical protein
MNQRLPQEKEDSISQSFSAIRSLTRAWEIMFWTTRGRSTCSICNPPENIRVVFLSNLVERRTLKEFVREIVMLLTDNY